MTPIERLIEADRMAPKRILVVGDSMIDQWIYGKVSESQDGCAKCVFEETDPLSTPGGAAGAARQLSHWNAKVFLASIFDNGRVPVRVLGCLQRVNYKQYSSPGYWLPVKRRYLEGTKIHFRADCEMLGQPYDLSESALHAAREKVVQAVRHCQFGAILISDYDKGFLDAITIQKVIQECRRQEIPCVADAKRDPELYKGAILKCNNDYAKKHIGVDKWPYLMTRGTLCPVVCGKDYTNWVTELNHRPVECINHVGAGDCFAAHLTLALANDLGLEEAAAVAHSAGRVYVQRKHGEPPTPQEIAADLAGAPAAHRGDA